MTSEDSEVTESVYEDRRWGSRICEDIRKCEYWGIHGHMRTDDMTMCMRNTCDLKWKKRSSNSEFHKCVLLPDSPLLHKQTKSSTKVIFIEDPNIAGLASRQIRGEAVKGELCLFLDFPNLIFSFFSHSCHSKKNSFFCGQFIATFFRT